MTRARRAAVFLLSLLFAAGLAAWCLWVPRRPEGLFRAIPRGATVLVHTRDLASQWATLAANPLARVALGGAGMSAADLDQSLTNREFAAWMERLAGGEIAAAYVPQFVPGGGAGWVFASWLGADSRRLRWTLDFVKVPGIRKMIDYRGHAVWTYRPRGWRSPETISLSLTDGMLVGCIADRTTAMLSVLDTYDGQPHAPGLDAAAVRSPFPPGTLGGWVRPDTPRGGEFAFSAVIAASNRLAVTLDTPWTWPATNAAAGGEPPVAFPDDLNGWVVADKSLLFSWLAPRATNGVWPQVLAFLDAQTGPRVGVGLLSEPCSGRFQGMKVPTLFLAAVPTDAAALPDAIRRELDAINVSNKAGLVLHPFPPPAPPVVAVESVMDTPYAKFAVDDLIAWQPDDRAYVFATNLRGLTNALVRAGASAWGRAPSSPDPLYGFFNLRDGGKAIRVALAAWEVKLAFDDPDGTAARRQTIDEIKAWIDVLAGMEQVTFSAPSAREVRLELEFGPARRAE
jgi:hypothetical protein